MTERKRQTFAPLRSADPRKLPGDSRKLAKRHAKIAKHYLIRSRDDLRDGKVPRSLLNLAHVFTSLRMADSALAESDCET